MTDEQIDALVKVMCDQGKPSAEALNVMHAARPDHPLGRGNAWRYRNALFMFHQHASHSGGQPSVLRKLSNLARREGSTL